MKKVMMAMTMMFALGCFAQTSGSGSMGSNGSSGQSSSSGSMSNGQSGSMDNGSMNSSSNNGMKGEKTLKGCIQSQNGGYVLQEKDGKMAMLNSSQDLSAHVGHTVKVHGMWEKSGSSNSGSMSSGSNSNATTSSSSTTMPNNSQSDSAMGSMGSMDHSGQSFMVNKLDMVSDQCKMDKDMSH